MIESFLFAAAVSSAVIGTFGIQTRIDPITDDRRVMALLVSDDTTLAIGCMLQSKQVFVTLQARERIGLNADLKSIMTIRFDADAPFEQAWQSKEELAYLDNVKQVAAFANRLRTAKKVVIRWPAIEGGYHDGIFTVDGADAAMKTVSSSCSDRKFSTAMAGS